MSWWKFRQAETAVAWITFPIQIGSRTRSPNWFSWLAWFTKCAWGGSSLNRICKSPSRSDLILSITPVRVMHVSTISNLLALYTWFQSESLHFPGVDSETVTLDDDNGSGDVAWGDEEKPCCLHPCHLLREYRFGLDYYYSCHRTIIIRYPFTISIWTTVKTFEHLGSFPSWGTTRSQSPLGLLWDPFGHLASAFWG